MRKQLTNRETVPTPRGPRARALVAVLRITLAAAVVMVPLLLCDSHTLGVLAQFCGWLVVVGLLVVAVCGGRA